MKILLLGDYSNVHATLAEGLKSLGHEVVVASDGDGWKNYRRDIDMKREGLGKWATIKYITRTLWQFRKFRNYDVVQIINPIFLSLRANKIKPFYKYLRRNNKKVFLGAFGMDYYWVKTGLDCKTFRYSDFNLGDKQRTEEEFNKEFIRDWIDGEKTEINKFIARDCDGIIGGLWEYYQCYRKEYPDKLRFIPFPINLSEITSRIHDASGRKINFFVGISKNRNAYKGTDIMLRALERVKDACPHNVEITRVEGVPFYEYVKLMDSSDVILDQLYSYTPAMNALQAMAQGLIVIGGGEPENYEILSEKELRPIINVLPDEEDCYNKMLDVAHHPERISKLSAESIEYIRRHHDHIKVAKQYISFWNETQSPQR